MRAKKLLKDLGYDYAELPLAHANRSRILGAIAGAGALALLWRCRTEAPATPGA